MYKFYDTCSLLLKANNLWEEDIDLVISSITLDELENIKSSNTKDEEIKFSARKVLNELDEHFDSYKVIPWNTEMLDFINRQGMPLTNDSKIIACAMAFASVLTPSDKIVFVTNDLSCKHLAHAYLPMDIESYKEEPYNYDGYKEIIMADAEMAEFYSNLDKNSYDLFINEYLIIKDKENQVVDKLCWTGKDYRRLSYRTLNSTYFGDIKPIKNDPYQAILIDSFVNNKMTLVKGSAGTGKTLLSLGFLLNQLEHNKIDKIVIFCNTVATKNSAKLGFYPGTRDEKLLDSQIGTLLSSKLGSKIAVEQMIEEEKLVLIPFSDIRGYDTTGMRAGIYISEAQNLDIELMKLALQRIGEDSICIVDGDYKAQVDDINFAGNNNGMKRASKVFRGASIYGEVTLRNIYRSEIAKTAELM